MPSVSNWKIPSAVQPKPDDYGYDLDHALSCVVGLHATVPADAFTAETLGTERAGNGVFIRSNGLVLTIGYLITEADTIWIALNDGRSVPGHVLGYDQESGFGLVQSLAKLDVPAMEIGDSAAASIGERVVVGGFGGRQRSGAARTLPQPAVRRLLGIRAGRGDLHRASASKLGRHRFDRTGRRSPGHRFAAIAARRRARPDPKHQHDSADRSAETDRRRSHEIRPPQRGAAAVARPLRHRSRE